MTPTPLPTLPATFEQVDSYAGAVPETVLTAERDAATLLDSWWADGVHDAPLPVDPYMLARQLGITVREAALPTDESGSIAYRRDVAVITINKRDHSNRQRFTCAHEIGHYVRHRANGRRDRLVDYRSTLAGLGVDTEEVFANQFAAALLMPAHLVERWKHRSVNELAALFGTSVGAMEIRLRNLGLA